MSSANERCNCGLDIALPPYLTTTILPWKRSSHGSASMRTAAFSRASFLLTSGSPQERERSEQCRGVSS